MMRLIGISENLINRVRNRFNFALIFPIILIRNTILSLLFGTSIFISVSHALQHEEYQNQFELQMYLEANEIKVNYDNNSITAIGDVHIHYDQYDLRASKVYLNRDESILTAEENVELSEPNGYVITAEKLELSEDFKTGVFHHLQVETIHRAFINSRRADRMYGTITSLKDGLYSPYIRQTDGFTPPWRIHASEIIFNQNLKTISFKDSTFEVFGLPVFVIPNISITNPSVTNISGFLRPAFFSDTKLGFGLAVPYYIAAYPNRDFTVSSALLSNQGLLVGGEIRHRLRNGGYSIRSSGISQANPQLFEDSVGNREFRGAVNFIGGSRINKNWSWDWDLNAFSDSRFAKDYAVTTLARYRPIQNVNLIGRSNSNTFEAQFYRFKAFTIAKNETFIPTTTEPFSPIREFLQDKQPLIHPMIDYQYYLKNSILGGKVSFGSNIVSLTRKTTDAFAQNEKYFFRGVKGTISRMTLFADWRRNSFHQLGHVFTPFLNLQGDFYVLSDIDQAIAEITSDQVVFKGMPTLGLEYRFPLIDNYFWGSQVIEPVAQLIVRPNESRIGELPIEDSQNFVFDTSNLFEINKFSGFDRTEGGIRANLGIRQILQSNNGGSINTLIGQSFHLHGTNSFAKPDITHSTGSSGIQTDISDYVGSIHMDSNIGLRIGTNARINREELKFSRLEVESATLLGPISASLNYAFLEEQPEKGINLDRHELSSAANIRLFDKFRVFGSFRYDLLNQNFINDIAGFGYDDEGFSFSVTFSETRDRFEGTPESRSIFFRFGLRTLLESGFSYEINTEPEEEDIQDDNIFETYLNNILLPISQSKLLINY